MIGKCMGAKKRRLERMKARHPYCCFCGGTVPTETIEHAPPIVFYRDKQRPKGLEFPACKRCNIGSGQLDQIAAYFSIVQDDSYQYDPDGSYSRKLLDGVRNNVPSALSLREGSEEDLMFNNGHHIYPVVKFAASPELDRFIRPWAAKQIAALWYDETGQPFSEEQYMQVRYYTNYQLETSGAPGSIFEMVDKVGALETGKFPVGEYVYRFNVSPERGLGAFFVSLYGASAFIGVVFPKSMREEFSAEIADEKLFVTSAATGLQRLNDQP